MHNLVASISASALHARSLFSINNHVYSAAKGIVVFELTVPGGAKIDSGRSVGLVASKFLRLLGDDERDVTLLHQNELSSNRQVTSDDITQSSPSVNGDQLLTVADDLASWRVAPTWICFNSILTELNEERTIAKG